MSAIVLSSASDKEKTLDDVPVVLATDGRRDSNDGTIGKGLFVSLKLDAWCIVANDAHAVGTSVASLPATEASRATCGACSMTERRATNWR